MRPRLRAGARVRPLSFTVRRHAKSHHAGGCVWGFLCRGGLEPIVYPRLATSLLLFTLLGKSTGEPQKFAPKRRLWAIPLLLLHPASWALLGVLYLTYLAYAGRVAAVWGWFVGSFFLSIVVMWTVAVIALYRLRRKRSRV